MGALPMRLSQAFATLRVAVIAGLTDQIMKELLPNFNSEVEDIRVQWEKKRAESEALADHEKRARIADLIVRRDAFIESLNNDLRLQLGARAKAPEYGGEIKEVPDAKKEGKTVLEVKFKDGSTARMPKSLWVDYKAFSRV
jgi:hypothetical protein